MYRPKRYDTCSMCDKPAVGRGLCHRHYYRLRKQGLLPDRKEPCPKDIFMSRIVKTESCWEWSGATTRSRNGAHYGAFMLPGGKVVKAHRYMYEITHGVTLSKTDVVMHACDNPICVNPAHLSKGTHEDNNKDCARKGRNAFAERHPGCKLSSLDVAFIRASPWSQVYLARIFSVDASHISNIKNYKVRIKG